MSAIAERDWGAHCSGMRSLITRRTLRSTLWIYLSFLAFALSWLLLDQLKLLKPLEDLSMDARFNVRGALPPPLKVIYVDIDNDAILDLGSFPWERGIFAKVCEVLERRGKVKAIGIDVVFSFAGIPNIADMEKVSQGHAEWGQYLFNSAHQPPVVIAATYAGGRQLAPDGTSIPRDLPLVRKEGARDRPEVPEWEWGGMTRTPPLIGVIDTLAGDTRSVPLVAPAEDRNYYHLSLELARLHFGVASEGVIVAQDHIDLVRPDGTLARRIPLIDGQMADVNWFSPWIHSSNPRFSISALLTAAVLDLQLASGELSAEDAAMAREHVDKFFKNNDFTDAVVLIGPVDALMQDLGPSPFDSNMVPKVGVHGNMLKTIVSGRFLKTLPHWANPVLTLLLTVVVAGLSVASEGKGSGLMRVIAVAVLVGYVAVTFLAFSWFDWVLPMVVPLGAALTSAFVGGAVQLVLAQKQKSRIKGLFGAYLAPAIVSQMVDSGQEPKLGGVDEDITAYFSDIQSFSTFSEVLSPTQLVELMNEYLTACTDIIQAEEGTLDKYIGDAVVAMYGAPLRLSNHAHRACLAALRVERRCADLREKWRQEMPTKHWPEIVTRLRTRVGLNSGRAVVGNMGSATRFSYTMMGDTVNLAARMESGAKSWGVYSMCADPTRRASEASDPGAIVFRALGRIVVKGRKTPVPIHELVGIKGEVDDRALEGIALFEAGLERYYMQDWDGALEKFEASAALELRQPDPAAGVESNPSLVYRRIVAELRSYPPGADWNGAYVMHEK